MLALAILTAAVVYGLDQATKAIVERTMTLGQEIPLIDGLLQWHYILNPGAAFSMGESLTWVFTAVMAIASAGILLFLPRVRSLLWALSLGLVLGGALGNLYDRMVLGHVVDFILVHWQNRWYFPAFNLADSAITVGAVMLALDMFRSKKSGEAAHG